MFSQISRDTINRVSPMSEGHEAKVEFSPDGTKAVFTFTVDRLITRDVIDRWTFSDCLLTIRAGDREIVLSFPKITEGAKK